jgi:hypothetical protein
MGRYDNRRSQKMCRKKSQAHKKDRLKRQAEARRMERRKRR